MHDDERESLHSIIREQVKTNTNHIHDIYAKLASQDKKLVAVLAFSAGFGSLKVLELLGVVGG